MADARFSLRSLLRPWQIASGRLAPLLGRRPPKDAAASASPAAAVPDAEGAAMVTAVAAAPATPPPAPVLPMQTGNSLWAQPAEAQWLRVGWTLGEGDRQRLQQDGLRLALRLSDQASAASPSPQAVMELTVDAAASSWELPVPLGGRAYRLSLGLRSEAGLWQELASAEGLWVDAAFPAAPQPQPLSFPEPDLASLPAAAAPSPLVMAGVTHEQSYQRATASWRRLGLGSESIQLPEDSAASAGTGAAGLDSGAGVWASGRDSGVGGVAARQRRFWLVADAELIVYGATDPAASLRIGEASVPLSEAGTFRVHVPFADGEQTYPIHATAADGEQQRHVRLEFNRSTPERQTNTAAEAVDEWF